MKKARARHVKQGTAIVNTGYLALYRNLHESSATGHAQNRPLIFHMRAFIKQQQQQQQRLHCSSEKQVSKPNLWASMMNVFLQMTTMLMTRINCSHCRSYCDVCVVEEHFVDLVVAGVHGVWRSCCLY